MSTHLRYRYRIYPTGPQRASLAKVFGCCRVVFNDAVAARRAAFESGNPYPSSAELQRLLITEAKRTDARAWLTEVSVVALQQAIRDCDAAYRAFFRSRAGKRTGPQIGPPRFKRRVAEQSARFTRRGFSVRENARVYVAGVGEMKVAWSRPLPAEPSSVTVIKTSTGKYFVSFVVAVEGDSEAFPATDAETGIDLGVKDFAVLRGGRTIDNPRFFARLERKLAKAQRRLARKQKGSRNREKARVQVARVHERIRQRREDFLSQLVADIVAENQAIYVEDLNLAGLARGRGAKSIHDAALGRFGTLLESKADRTGREIVRIDRYFPSTRLCSVCGALAGPQGSEGLKVRRWVCPCGARHSRDANAEINIRREGQRVLAERRRLAEGRSSSR